MTPDHTITAAVVAILLADRPAAIPSDLVIVTAQETAPLERPYLLARCQASTHAHPRLFLCELSIELHVRADDQDAETSGAWHQAAADYFIQNPAALFYTLRDAGLRVLAFTPRGGSEELEASRGRGYTTTWPLTGEIL